MPGRRRPDDFSLLRKSQAPRFTGLGAEAKTGSGSAETENGRGGMPLPPPRVQCRFAFGEVRCGIEAKTGSGSAETRTAEGGRFRRPVCNAGLPSGRSDAEYILGRRSCFRRAGRRAEVCPIVSKKERRRPVRAVFSCRFLLRTQPAEHGPGGRLPPPEAAAARPEERRSENRRMLEECRFWRLRVLSGRAVQRPAIRKTSDVRRGVGCGGEGSIAGRKARKRRNSLYRPVGTDGRASQLENRRPPILLRESAGEAPVRWW